MSGIPSHEDILVDLLEDGSDVGPNGRNLAIWDETIEDLENNYYKDNSQLTEKQFKMYRATYIMIKEEFKKLKGTVGMAILSWYSLNINRGKFSILFLFNDGKVNLNQRITIFFKLTALDFGG